MNDIIFIDFFILIIRLYYFNIKLRINDKAYKIIFKKIILKEIYTIISKNRKSFSIISNSRSRIEENQFIEFIRFENRYQILKY